MASSIKNRPSGDREQAIVRAPTLKEALRKARALYGEEVRILASRQVVRRQSDGLGQDALIEISILTNDAVPTLSARVEADQAASAPTGGSLSHLLRSEVERIERLTEMLTSQKGQRVDGREGPQDYPLAAPLAAAGASPATIGRLATLFRAEIGSGKADWPAAVNHLRLHLRAGSGRWEDFGGCHIFLGDSGAGKTDTVLGTAARLQEAGRSPLVLSLLPRHGGEVRRLQLEAAQHNYDAAVINRQDQLERLEESLSRYDVVLMDTPGLFGKSMVEAGDLQRYLAQNERFHRHLVAPLDMDIRLGSALWEAARIWNCDWTVVTRLDRAGGFGRALDIYGKMGLPVSMLSAGPWPEARAELATVDMLAELMLKNRDERGAAAATA
jgi:flagellar biosynthesis GTPase FlhF